MKYFSLCAEKLITGNNMRTLVIVLSSVALVLSIVSIIISVKSIRSRNNDDEKRGGKDA